MPRRGQKWAVHPFGAQKKISYEKNMHFSNLQVFDEDLQQLNDNDNNKLVLILLILF